MTAPPPDPNYPEQRTPFRIVGVQQLYDRPLPRPITSDDWLPEESRILDREWVQRINGSNELELVYDCFHPNPPNYKSNDLSGTMIFNTAFGPDKLTRWTMWGRKAGFGKGIEEETEMWTVVKVGRRLAGHHDVLHGGFTATLLDDALGVTAYRATHATPSFTGTLTVNYKSTIPLPSVLLIRTRVKSRNGRKMDVEGEVYVEGKGKPAVTASGLWILMREDHREEKYGKRTAKDERLVRKEGVAAKL